MTVHVEEMHTDVQVRSGERSASPPSAAASGASLTESRLRRLLEQEARRRARIRGWRFDD